MVLRPQRAGIRRSLHRWFRRGDRPPDRHASPLHLNRLPMDRPCRRLHLSLLSYHRQSSPSPSHKTQQGPRGKTHRFIGSERSQVCVARRCYFFLGLGFVWTFDVYYELFIGAGNFSGSLVLHGCLLECWKLLWSSYSRDSC